MNMFESEWFCFINCTIYEYSDNIQKSFFLWANKSITVYKYKDPAYFI